MNTTQSHDRLSYSYREQRRRLTRSLADCLDNCDDTGYDQALVRLRKLRDIEKRWRQNSKSANNAGSALHCKLENSAVTIGAPRSNDAVLFECAETLLEVRQEDLHINFVRALKKLGKQLPIKLENKPVVAQALMTQAILTFLDESDEPLYFSCP